MSWQDCKESNILIKILAILLILINSTQCNLEDLEPKLDENYLLCRTCGNDIGVTKQLLNNKISPDSKHFINESLFNVDEVLVQELVNPLGLRFRVVLLDPAVKKVDCQARLSDDWIAAGSWFPGYAWKACHCPKCGAHLGWIFEPVETALDTVNQPTNKGFFAIIIAGIVDEHFIDSLVVREKLFRETE